MQPGSPGILVIGGSSDVLHRRHGPVHLLLRGSPAACPHLLPTHDAECERARNDDGADE
jgi:hypothetical protein